MSAVLISKFTTVPGNDCSIRTAFSPLVSHSQYPRSDTIWMRPSLRRTNSRSSFRPRPPGIGPGRVTHKLGCGRRVHPRDRVDIVLLSANFLFFVKDFLQFSAFVPPLRGSSLGGFPPPRFRSASPGVTHGATSTRLGVALRSFWPSGRRPESPPCPSRQTGQLKKPTGQTVRLPTISFVKTTTLQKISVHLCPSVVKK